MSYTKFFLYTVAAVVFVIIVALSVQKPDEPIVVHHADGTISELGVVTAEEKARVIHERYCKELRIELADKAQIMWTPNDWSNLAMCKSARRAK